MFRKDFLDRTCYSLIEQRKHESSINLNCAAETYRFAVRV